MRRYVPVQGRLLASRRPPAISRPRRTADPPRVGPCGAGRQLAARRVPTGRRRVVTGGIRPAGKEIGPMNKVLLTGRLTREPGDAQPRQRQGRHHVHRRLERIHRWRQGESRVPPRGHLGSPRRDRRPLSGQGPAGGHRGPAPDPVMGRRPRRAALEDRGRRRACRDAVGEAQEEGLRGAAGRRLALRPGVRPRRGACGGTHRR